MNKKRLTILLITIVLIIAGGLGGFFIYIGTYSKAEDKVYEYLKSDEYVEVIQEDDLYIYKPKSTRKGNVIFYQGGKVEYIAYAPLMYKLSKNGYQCYLPHLKFNLAFFDINKASSIKEKYIDNQEEIYLLGHSLGGASLGNYAENNIEGYKGIGFLAAYTTADLSNTNLSSVFIYGDKDGVLNIEKYEECKKNVNPNLSHEYIIEGGNHAGFGMYGNQKDDNEASISQLVQMDLTVNYLVSIWDND